MTFDPTRGIGLGLEGATREFPRLRTEPTGASFLDTLKSSLGEVARLDQVANTQVQALAEGRATDPHEIVLAVEQANMALDLLIEIRNRLLETYQELTRTQI